MQLMSVLRKKRKSEEGGSTVEFVIVFPVFIAIVLSMFESGWLMTKYMMLDRGVDMAVRDLKLGIMINPTPEELRTQICEYSAIFNNCEQEMFLELRQYTVIAGDANYPHRQPACYNRNETAELQPVMTIAGSTRGEIVFLRACMLVNPIFPGLGLGAWLPKAELDEDAIAAGVRSGHQMVSYGVFLNEPS